jgi:hypothetical protein
MQHTRLKPMRHMIELDLPSTIEHSEVWTGVGTKATHAGEDGHYAWLKQVCDTLELEIFHQGREFESVPSNFLLTSISRHRYLHVYAGLFIYIK